MIKTNMRSSKATAKVMVHVKKLSLTLKNHIFDGTDPIRAFDFLARFVDEVEMLNKSVAQTFMAVPIFLDEPAKTLLRTSLRRAKRRGGITCWPEDIPHLLRIYPSAQGMREVLEDLHSICRGETEVKE